LMQPLLRHFSIFISCILVVPGAGAQDASTAIAAALHEHNYQRAVELAHFAIQQSPSDARLWTLQGVALAAQGKKQEALSSFRNALKLAPNHLPALQQEAQLYYESNDLAGVPVLQHILRLQPGDPMSHAMIAVLEYKHGNCAVAVPHFAKSGELLDSQLDGLHAYATCLVKLKRLDNAIEVFQRAVTLQPEEPRQRSLLASLQLMAHKPQDAIATLAPILQGGSANPQVLELASSAYEDAGDTTQAVSMLRQAILADPQNVSLYLDFAQISAAHDSYQVGVNAVSDGIQQQPKSAQLYLARGVLYVQLAQYEKAEADFEKAYELDPNQSLSIAAQGLTAVQSNDLDRVLKLVRAKLAHRPNDPILLYVQADILTQQGADPRTPQFTEAMRSAKKAVALQPRLGAARSVLAKLYLQSGQNQLAIEQSRKALEIDPKDQTSLYRLIQALRKASKTDEVPDLLKRLAELRQQAAKQQKQRSRYKLVEEETGQ
jgi:tetratricopeptide (TPR) repeat protein